MFKVLDDDHYIMGSHQRIQDVLWLYIPHVSTTPRLHDQFLIRVALGPHMATQARRGDLLVGRRARGKQVSIVFPSPRRRRATPLFTHTPKPAPRTEGAPHKCTPGRPTTRSLTRFRWCRSATRSCAPAWSLDWSKPRTRHAAALAFAPAEQRRPRLTPVMRALARSSFERAMTTCRACRWRATARWCTSARRQTLTGAGVRSFAPIAHLLLAT